VLEHSSRGGVRERETREKDKSVETRGAPNGEVRKRTGRALW
jgi:hypothetical protein